MGHRRRNGPSGATPVGGSSLIRSRAGRGAAPAVDACSRGAGATTRDVIVLSSDHRAGCARRDQSTWIMPIMPRSACSRMWQWNIHMPGRS
jgi:hypothetical protein